MNVWTYLALAAGALVLFNILLVLVVALVNRSPSDSEQRPVDHRLAARWAFEERRQKQKVACVALLVALTGTSYATVLNVPKNSVGTAELKRNAVKPAKIAPNAVRTAHVLNGSLLAADFKAGQLPAGAKGDKGDKGEKGDKGVKGDEGAPGLSGVTYVTATTARTPTLPRLRRRTAPARSAPSAAAPTPPVSPAARRFGIPRRPQAERVGSAPLRRSPRSPTGGH